MFYTGDLHWTWICSLAATQPCAGSVIVFFVNALLSKGHQAAEHCIWSWIRKRHWVNSVCHCVAAAAPSVWSAVCTTSVYWLGSSFRAPAFKLQKNLEENPVSISNFRKNDMLTREPRDSYSYCFRTFLASLLSLYPSFRQCSKRLCICLFIYTIYSV
jgi:hypothetical protein